MRGEMRLLIVDSVWWPFRRTLEYEIQETS